MDIEKFVVTPKNDTSIAISIRVPKKTYNFLHELSQKSNRSYNELVNMALDYAVNKVNFIEKENKEN